MSVTSASLSPILDDTGSSSTDWITKDTTLTVSGSATATGASTLGIWISGGGFGNANGGKGTLVGSVSVPDGSAGWSFDLTTSGIAGAQNFANGNYTVSVTRPSTSTACRSIRRRPASLGPGRRV